MRWINANPAAGIQTRVGGRKAGTKARHPFTGAQLRLILEKAEETQFGGKKRHADALWALRVAIWAGARIGEVCQLRKEDVTVLDGVPVIMIRAEHPEQSVKNDNSARHVPLHPAIADGFLAHARGAGDWVFTSFTHCKSHGRAGWIIDAFPALRRGGCGLNDPKLTVHSIRHSFIDAMRRADIPEDRRKCIVGHAGKDVHSRYGLGAGLKALASEVARIDPMP